MTPTESLRHSVRDHLDLASQEVSVEQGTGRTCIVCATVISPDQIEDEIVVRTSGIAITLWAHLPCFNVWRWASRVFEEEH